MFPCRAGATTFVSGTINTNQTWTTSGMPYVLQGNVFVASGVTLTINPGTIIKGDANSWLVVNGRLLAQGTSSQQIIFTSYKDDYYLGDTNGDGFSVGVAADWGGIQLYGQAAITDKITYTIIKNPTIGVDILYSPTELSYDTFTDGVNGLQVTGVPFTNSYSFDNLIFSYFSNDAIKTSVMSTLIDTLYVSGGFGGGAHGITQNGGILTCLHCEVSGEAQALTWESSGTTVLDDAYIHNNGLGVTSEWFSNSTGTTYTITNSVFENNGTAINSSLPLQGSVSNSSLRNNTTAVHFSWPGSHSGFDMRNNWWGSSTGPHHLVLNSAGTGGNIIATSPLFIPWFGVDPFPSLSTTPSNLLQYKRDGQTLVPEGATSMSKVMELSATLPSLGSVQYKLQIEVKPLATAFDGMGLIDSTLGNPGTVATVEVSNGDGEYHWRARSMDAGGIASGWQEFGVPGNKDFTIKHVYMFTQTDAGGPLNNEGIAPTWGSTEMAPNPPIDPGLTDCAKKVNGGTKRAYISYCGCTLTSIVMVFHYLGVHTLNGQYVTPRTLSDAIAASGGYSNSGEIIWSRMPFISNFQIEINPTLSSFIGADVSKLDLALNSGIPVILPVSYLKNGITHSHFIVATNKLQGTYEINDPSYFNTHHLDEPAPDFANRINDYDNAFSGNRVLRKSTIVSHNFPISSLRVIGGTNVYIQDQEGHITGIRDGEILNEIKDIDFMQYNNPPDSGEEDSRSDDKINEYEFIINRYMKDLVLYAASDKENKKPITLSEFIMREGRVLANNQITLKEDIDSVQKELSVDDSPHLVAVNDDEVTKTVFYKDDPMYKNNEIK